MGVGSCLYYVDHSGNRRGGYKLPSYFQINGVVQQMPYFLIGLILRDEELFIKKAYKKYKRPIIVVAIVLVVVGTYIFKGISGFNCQILQVLLSVAIMVLLYEIASNIKIGNKPLNIIGKYSLQIMFLDSFYKVIIFKVFGRYITNIIGVLIVSLVDLSLCVATSIVLEKIPVVNKLLGLGWKKTNPKDFST